MPQCSLALILLLPLTSSLPLLPISQNEIVARDSSISFAASPYDGTTIPDRVGKIDPLLRERQDSEDEDPDCPRCPYVNARDASDAEEPPPSPSPPSVPVNAREVDLTLAERQDPEDDDCPTCPYVNARELEPSLAERQDPEDDDCPTCPYVNAREVEPTLTERQNANPIDTTSQPTDTSDPFDFGDGAPDCPHCPFLNARDSLDVEARDVADVDVVQIDPPNPVNARDLAPTLTLNPRANDTTPTSAEPSETDETNSCPCCQGNKRSPEDEACPYVNARSEEDVTEETTEEEGASSETGWTQPKTVGVPVGVFLNAREEA
ncbi:MAG: hypothetical protein Q9227_000143 [Pyrenula ochraceoflavens]